MKAEDTVMNMNEIMLAIKDAWLARLGQREEALTDYDLYELRLKAVAEAQAKVSFKALREEQFSLPDCNFDGYDSLGRKGTLVFISDEN